MPEKIDLLELFDKLLLMAKIEQSTRQDNGLTDPKGHDLEKEMDMWG